MWLAGGAGAIGVADVAVGDSTSYLLGGVGVPTSLGQHHGHHDAEVAAPVLPHLDTALVVSHRRQHHTHGGWIVMIHPCNYTRIE